MNDKFVNKDTTKLIRLNSRYHRNLKILSAKKNRSIKNLIEESCDYILDLYRDNHAN